MSFLKNILKGISKITLFPKKTEPFKLTKSIIETSDEEAIRKDWETVGKDLQLVMDKNRKEMKKVNKIAYALAEFTTFVIDKYDTDDPSARTQLFVKGVFGGASCGSLVEYAKKQRLVAYRYLSPKEIKQIEERAEEGKKNESNFRDR